MALSVDTSQKDYPTLLKDSKNSPPKFFYKGSWDSGLFTKAITVVGARRMSRYGQQVIDNLIPELILNGITIVSGFTYGVDAYAQKVAIEAGGRTIAIMPCGIDRVWPAYNKQLYQQVLDNKGMIISEFEGDYEPQAWMFSRRNLTLGLISPALLVIEAGAKSNTLIIADLAFKHGRKVFAVPGPITNSSYQGALSLIKQGAEMVTCAQDISRFFGVGENAANENNILEESLFGLQKDIFLELQRQAMSLDEISKTLKVNVSECAASVSMMQLSGIVNEKQGQYSITKNYVN